MPPEIIERIKEGVKYDHGKARYDLIDPYALHMLALVYTMGAAKYEDNNWRKGLKVMRLFAAVMRHLSLFSVGQDVDKESGLPHLAHAAWGCFTMLWMVTGKPEFDDRVAFPESMIEQMTRTWSSIDLKEYLNIVEGTWPESEDHGKETRPA